MIVDRQEAHVGCGAAAMIGAPSDGQTADPGSVSATEGGSCLVVSRGRIEAAKCRTKEMERLTRSPASFFCASRACVHAWARARMRRARACS
eukprot:2243258-Pleurochrysis_carterae.AAC.1